MKRKKIIKTPKTYIAYCTVPTDESLDSSFDFFHDSVEEAVKCADCDYDGDDFSLYEVRFERVGKVVQTKKLIMENGDEQNQTK